MLGEEFRRLILCAVYDTTLSTSNTVRPTSSYSRNAVSADMYTDKLRKSQHGWQQTQQALLIKQCCISGRDAILQERMQGGHALQASCNA
jgi:hypothetical protein